MVTSGCGALVGMPRAGAMQQLEVGVGQLEHQAAERPGELRRRGTVIGVLALADPPGVVQDGEELHDLDPAPVSSASRSPLASTRASARSHEDRPRVSRNLR